MKVHYLQHVVQEDVANLEKWAVERSYSISSTLIFAGQDPPQLKDFDFLIVLGGETDICEEKYPWFVKEKKFLRRAIDGGKIVLGICMGAQHIAEVLGGRVRKNNYRKIGWFPLELTLEGTRSRIFGVLPKRFIAFHWHRDTFEMPLGAVRTARSDGCENEAFEIGKTVGLQFHLESSMCSLEYLMNESREELEDGRFIQEPEEILAQARNLQEINRLMELFLDNMVKMLY